MLVLTRNIGEKLVINGNITVEVVKIEGNRITLGLNAPADVKILRSELLDSLSTPQLPSRQSPRQKSAHAA